MYHVATSLFSQVITVMLVAVRFIGVVKILISGVSTGMPMSVLATMLASARFDHSLAWSCFLQGFKNFPYKQHVPKHGFKHDRAILRHILFLRIQHG